jgi:hypothetical protein
MLKHAFKEWAVICYCLAKGKQAIILRKGGIEEPGGDFHLEHKRFWLYPTYVHEKPDGLKEEGVALLESVKLHKPPEGNVRLSHLAEVEGVYHVHDLMAALKLESLHYWSPSTVESRFTYRHPGLMVMAVRVYEAAHSVDLHETAAFHGCKSWVELEKPLSTDGAKTVLDDVTFQKLMRTLDIILQPTAHA